MMLIELQAKRKSLVVGKGFVVDEMELAHFAIAEIDDFGTG